MQCQRPCSTPSAAHGGARSTDGTARRSGRPDRLGKTRRPRRAVHSHHAYLEGARMGASRQHDVLPATAAPTHSGVSTIIRRLVGVAKRFKLAGRPRCRGRSGGGAHCSVTLRCRSAPLARLVSLAPLHVHGRAVGLPGPVPHAHRRGQDEA